MHDDGHPCVDCGAAGCEARFHACLAADFSDPAYGRVHHLVVPTYGLQHGWYSAVYEPWAVEFLHDHLDRPPSDHERRSIRAAADGPTQVRDRQPRHRAVDWPRHVGHVDLTSADTYVTTVRRWADSVATTLLG